ncbi:hypothetical protein VFPBJ_01407 [Purpureocillium lilacinum]|uniref:Uncharacterized protein n=1 Tax=Purpureocillium lilacinum TaxID=33203 RepID=A0A179HB20_PURLI|nr:hypothetical protein VFPBJ_01407 [Purpureocillium lilacinum]
MLTCTTNFQVTCAPLEYPGLAATVPTSLDAAVEPPPPTPGLRRCYSVERQRRPTLRLRSRNNLEQIRETSIITLEETHQLMQSKTFETHQLV